MSDPDLIFEQYTVQAVCVSVWVKQRFATMSNTLVLNLYENAQAVEQKQNLCQNP